ncbi:hypothetical protein PG989_009038 [Apiospora arundinis]
MDSGGWRLFLRLLAANNFFSIEVYMGKRSRPLANINPSQLFQYLFVVFYPLVSFSCSAGFSFLYKLKSRSEDLCQYITAEPGSLQLQKKKSWMFYRSLANTAGVSEPSCTYYSY